MRNSTFIRPIFKTILALFFLVISVHVSAQLKALFDVSVTSGCAPLQVTFTSKSTGNIKYYYWYTEYVNETNLGGTPYTLPSPSRTYTVGGTYSIKLVIEDANGNKDSIIVKDLITVFQKPDVCFDAPNIGCVPFSTCFNNCSKAYGSNIAKYAWTFGNNSSTLEKPCVNYPSAGTYTVTLSVTDDNGCVNSKQALSYITVLPQPAATFKATKTTACAPPLTTTLTADDTSSAYTYTWDVQGVGTFSGKTVNDVLFDKTGRYDVTLHVTGPGGCDKTTKVTGFIAIENPIASFSVPQRTCVGSAITFTNTSKNATGATYDYDWGDGTTHGKIASPGHNYTTPGEKIITQVVTSADGNCSSTFIDTIEVQQPKADFKIIPQTGTRKAYGCKPFNNFTFVSTSTGAATYNWTWGDGTFGGGDTAINGYFSGDYTVILEAYSSNGCRSTATGLVQVDTMYARFSSDKATGGCAPLTMKFTDQSFSDSAITSYTWTFHDGSTQTGKNASFVYPLGGVFDVKLRVQNSFGCVDTTSIKVEAGYRPKADYIRTPAVACATSPILFQDKSTVVGDTGVTYWRWDFYSPTPNRDGSRQGSKFATWDNACDTGYFNTRYIVSHHGCNDTIYRNKDVYRYGPVLCQEYLTPVCVDPASEVDKNRVFLFANVKGYTSYDWFYGDGDSDNITPLSVNQDRPSPDPAFADSLRFDPANHADASKWHHYKTKGTYIPTINAMLNGIVRNPTNTADTTVSCTTPFQYPAVTIPDFEPQFVIPDTICYNNGINLLAHDTGDADRLEWFINDVLISDTIFFKVPASKFQNAAKHTVKLRLWYVNCFVDSVRTLTVLKPAPVINSASPSSGCAPLKVIFKGSDTSGVAVAEWKWNFASANPTFSLIQNPDTVRYNVSSPNNTPYPVTLTTKDIFGCEFSRSLAQGIKVTAPHSAFAVNKTNYCLGDTVKLTNQATPDSANIRWYYSSGDSSKVKSPVYVPDTFGQLIITQITDLGGGCYDTLRRTVIVEPVPTADFSVIGPSQAECYPFTGVCFATKTTPQPYSYSYQWSFGNGDTVGFGTGFDTTCTGFFNPGKYDVCLKAYSQSGLCKDSICKDDYIQVRGPSADFTISDTNVCVKDPIYFTMINPINISKFNWDFGDGSGFENDTVQFHSYPPPGGIAVAGTVCPLLQIESGPCKITISHCLFVNDVIARFTIPGDSATIGINPKKIGIDTIKACGQYQLNASLSGSFEHISSFRWHPNNGDPTNSTDSSITAIYKVGLHKMYLAVDDTASGCRDTIFQNIMVYPNAVANAGSDQILCPGDSSTLHGTGGIVYEWFPLGGLNRGDTSDVIVNPGSSSSYTLIVTDINHCKDTDDVFIFRDRTAVSFVLAQHTACGFMAAAPVNQSTGNVFDWLFDDNTPSSAPAPVVNFFQAGKHFIQLTGYDLDPKCTKTFRDTIEVFPLPSIIGPSDHTLCFGDSILLNTTVSGRGPTIIKWTPSTGLNNPDIASPIAKPDNLTQYIITVTDTNCVNRDTVNIDVDHATAKFTTATIDTCYQLPLRITNTSVGTSFKWEFDNDINHVTGAYTPVFTYTTAGKYTIRLTVVDKDIKCKKVATQDVIVHPAPPVNVNGGGFMCNYDSLYLYADGAVSYVWTPSTDLGTPNSAGTWCYADVNTIYTVIGTDAFNCQNKDSLQVRVQPDYSFQDPADDTLIIGEYKTFDVTAGPGNISYEWKPATWLSCSNCPNPTLQPLKTTCYEIYFVDDAKCYPKKTEVCVFVDEKYTVDVPNAFTPNGDGRNDKIYVRGFGIKKLLNFTIYNRWGEVVFETSDMAVGWDGVYKDKMQNDETYAFIVNVETWQGEVMNKNGYITLLK